MLCYYCRIKTDHNEDDTLSVLTEWTENVRALYSSVTLINEEEWLLSNRDPLKMTDERYERISQLRQEGLEEARRSGAHYLLVSTGEGVWWGGAGGGKALSTGRGRGGQSREVQGARRRISLLLLL